MSQLETEAIPLLRPMIEGDSLTLDRNGQITVAFWAALRAIMIRMSRSNQNPLLLNKWAKAMFERHKVPVGWHVWIASYQGRLPAYFESGDVERQNSTFRGFTVTFIAGAFAFKVIAVNKLSFSYRRRSGVVRMMPFEVPTVHWPPDPAIDDGMLAQFCQSGMPSPTKLPHVFKDIDNSKNGLSDGENLTARRSG